MDAAVFLKADSANLPKVDTFMLLEFMKNSDKHNVAEIRGVKALFSSRESYVETAVGYVEVKRVGNLCHVRAKVVPEHKVSQKYYVVVAELNDDTITDTSCDGCVAAAGGCKHTLVLLYWLQKRSSEPSPTSVQCYWNKPNLKRVQEEVVQSKKIFKNKIVCMGPRDPTVLEKFRAEAKKHNCGNSLIMTHDNGQSMNKLTSYCVFNIMVDFADKETDISYKNFITFSNAIITKDVINKIAQDTEKQVDSKLWHCVRQGRITGSKVHEVAHCKTAGGSLVEELLGGNKTLETKAMKRGKALEARVIKKLQEEINKDITSSGFILVDALFGASPDGIGDDFVVEVKCQISERTERRYINNDGSIPSKYLGQLQLEMLAANKNKGLFCIADPNFEVNEGIKMIVVDFDQQYILSLMNAAEEFWKKKYFPYNFKQCHVVDK